MNEDRAAWKRSRVGLATIVAVLLILVIVGSLLVFRQWQRGQGQIDHREPLPSISYCSAEQTRPCILSFTLEADGTMVIDIRTESLSSPEFNVKIKHGETQNFYVCRRASAFSTSIICTGKPVPVGEPVQFLILSKKDQGLIAEGTFPIIGLALATPEFASTPTFIPAWNRPPK